MKRSEIRDYLLLYYLIAITGIPFFLGDLYVIIGLIFTSALFFYRKKTLGKSVITMLFIYAILMAFHVFLFENFFLQRFVAFLGRILLAYLVVSLISGNFDVIYVKILKFFSIVSLLIYSSLLLNPDFILQVGTYIWYQVDKLQLVPFDSPHIILYTFKTDTQFEGYFLRNSGPFWEPGGFSVFLNIAIIFNTIREKRVLTKLNVLFSLVLLTTQSTGGILTYFFFLLCYLIFVTKSYSIILTIPIFVVLFYIAYTRFDFLNVKVSDEVEYSIENNSSNKRRTRLVSAIEDLETIRKYPLTGIGKFYLSEEEVNNYDNRQEYYRNNGTTNFLAEFGIIGFLTYFFFVFFSFKNLCISQNIKPNFAVIIIITLLIAGFSQKIFMKPFFWALAFLFLNKKTIKIAANVSHKNISKN